METKLIIPKGEYSTGDANERACASVKIENSDILIVIGFDDDIQENSIVKICSDGLNTYQSTGKLPSELAVLGNLSIGQKQIIKTALVRLHDLETTLMQQEIDNILNLINHD